MARGIEGLVLLRVRIGADGTVEAATIDQPSGTPSLDESALSTVRHRWHFEPATRCGAAVSYEAPNGKLISVTIIEAEVF